uniref:TPR_REGION domain-containing protein n=1 Tax=Bursaphelenchus xylophilus TaxID=6326 RepID=A0A1I7S956_BURXY
MFGRSFSRTSFIFRPKYSSGSNKDGGRKSQSGSKYTATYTKPLLALSVVGAIKEVLFHDTVKLDDDPIKDKIKQSWLQRKYKNFDEAIRILEEVLEEVKAKGDNSIEVTRVLDELANTYYFKGDWDQALGHFKLVVQRLIQLHQKNESSPEFIGISLKMAEILANQGDLENAEIGYRHCITKQMAAMDNHLNKYFISKGALIESPYKIEDFGQEYSDPIILFAMCLQQFAHFIIDYRDDSRESEACESMDEVLKLTYHIYGPNHPQFFHILNNFGAACILRNRFETAKKYLKVGAEKILYAPDCSDILVGYYCNYAEALFHTGSFDEAVQYAEAAVRMSNSAPSEIQTYAQNFLKQMKADLRRARKEAGRRSGQPDPPGWFSWFWGSSSSASSPTKTQGTAAADVRT